MCKKMKPVLIQDSFQKPKALETSATTSPILGPCRRRMKAEPDGRT